MGEQAAPIKPYIGTPPETVPSLPSAPTPMTSVAKVQSRPSGETVRATLCRTKMLACSHVVGTQEKRRSHKVANGQQLEAVHACERLGSSATKMHLRPSLQVCLRRAQQGMQARASFAAPANCRNGRSQAAQYAPGCTSFNLLVNTKAVYIFLPSAALEAA